MILLETFIITSVLGSIFIEPKVVLGWILSLKGRGFCDRLEFQARARLNQVRFRSLRQFFVDSSYIDFNFEIDITTCDHTGLISYNNIPLSVIEK